MASEDMLVVNRHQYDDLLTKMRTMKMDLTTFRTDISAIKNTGAETQGGENITDRGQESRLGQKPVDEDTFSLKPIGTLCSVYKELNGTPRQPGLCKDATASLTIGKNIFNNPEHSLEDLAHFSHIWVLFIFHKNKNAHTKAKVKPPRMDGKKTGVFSTRSPYRPNPIGLSLAKLDRVEGSTLYMSGIDMVDGTPILDIKPYIPYCDNPAQQSGSTSDGIQDQDSSQDPDVDKNPSEEVGEARIALWLETNAIGSLTVRFTPTAEQDLEKFDKDARDDSYKLKHYDSAQSVRTAIQDILQNDPRSAYRRKKCLDRLYYFSVDTIHVTCWFDNEKSVAEVLCCKPHTGEQPQSETGSN